MVEGNVLGVIGERMRGRGVYCGVSKNWKEEATRVWIRGLRDGMKMLIGWLCEAAMLFPFNVYGSGSGCTMTTCWEACVFSIASN